MKAKGKNKNTGRLVLCIIFAFCVFNWLFLTVNNWFLLITVINSRQEIYLTLDPWGTSDYASSSEDEEVDMDWITEQLDPPGTPAILHVTKEFKPIATVGGVGSVVGGLAKSQGHLRSTWAVLPRYRFITEPHKLIFPVEIKFRGKTVNVNIYYLKSGSVNLLLVGDGKHPFFRQMWSDKIQDIYGLKPTMSYTHRDAFFVGAVKGIIEKMRKIGHPIETLHIHGATNALLMPTLDEHQNMSVVYTLHDYLYEPYYRLSMATLQEFEIPTNDEGITMPCLIGIMYSDVVTAVSRGMVEAVLSREVVFPYQREIVTKYLAGGVVGIPNAIDTALNPKNSPTLKMMNYSFANGVEIERTKEDVKTYLIEQGLIGTTVPIVLFIGRLEAVKGIHTFAEVAQLTEKLNFQFVIMGSYTSGQAEHWNQIKSMLDNYENVLVVDDRENQEKYGVLLRAAADFVFVPSEKEAFGLVSAEACKFASIPIINDIPGLRDTITDYGGKTPWSGFLYGKSRTLEEVFKTATIVFKIMEYKEKTELYENLTSLHKDWSEKDGPTTAYLQAYERAAFLHGMQKAGRSSEIWNRKVGPNMLQNPSFSEVNDTGLAEYWTPYDSGYRMHNAGHNHPPSVLLAGGEHTGTCQMVDLQQREAAQVIVSGWSLAEGVDDNSEECLIGGYSLFVDVRFQDGTEIWGENVQFTAGTHTWEKQNLLLFYDKPIDKLTVCALFRCRLGYALFDDIQVFVVQQ